jgi:hypothetical protein
MRELPSDEDIAAMEARGDVGRLQATSTRFLAAILGELQAQRAEKALDRAPMDRMLDSAPVAKVPRGRSRDR